jgi:hypothetical protein
MFDGMELTLSIGLRQEVRAFDKRLKSLFEAVDYVRISPVSD